MRDILTAVIAITFVASCAPEEALEQVGDTLNQIGGGIIMGHNGSELYVSRLHPSDNKIVRTYYIDDFSWSVGETVWMTIAPDQLATRGYAVAHEREGRIRLQVVDMRTGETIAKLNERQILADLEQEVAVTNWETTYYELRDSCWTGPTTFMVAVQAATVDEGGDGTPEQQFYGEYSVAELTGSTPRQTKGMSFAAREPLVSPDGFTCRRHRFDASERMNVRRGLVAIDNDEIFNLPRTEAAVAVALPRS